MRISTFIALMVTVVIGCGDPAASIRPSDTVASREGTTPTTTPVRSGSPDAPSNSDPPSPAPSSGAASASSSPPPAAPPDLSRIAVKERDDIRVELELQRNPLRAGEPSWVKVRVTNQGRTDLTWFHDGCAEPVSVYGVSDIVWPMGEEHRGQAGRFKTYALGGHISERPSPPHAWLDFVHKERLHAGSTGCADVGIYETIAPGQTITATRWWSGFTALHWALPPAGRATIRGFAAYYWRGEEPSEIVDHAIELELDAWVTSDGAADRLSPAQAIDAALVDREFAAYLDTQSIPDGRAEIAWYDAGRDVWEIGVMPWYEADPPRIHGVLVDGITGAIVGQLDRPWDRSVDPFP